MEAITQGTSRDAPGPFGGHAGQSGSTGHSARYQVVLPRARYVTTRHPLLIISENQPGHSTMHRNLMCWFSCVMLLGVKYHHLTLVTGEEAEEMTLECLSRADRVISQLELVEMDGFLPYLYDAGTVGLSEWGIIVYQVSISQTLRLTLVQLYWRTPPAHRGFVLDLVHRANACCRRIAQGDNTAPPAFVGRFLERVIRLMNGQSRPHTRVPSPVPLNNHNGQERSVWQEGNGSAVNWALVSRRSLNFHRYTTVRSPLIHLLPGRLY
jgi:hypothetical protein